MAPIAAALGVEMLIELLNDPLIGEIGDLDRINELKRKNVPHMIRGYFSDFSQMSMIGWSFEQCTACSDKVIEIYEKQGFEFIEESIKVKYLLFCMFIMV